jgi:hypothetical protein
MPISQKFRKIENFSSLYELDITLVSVADKDALKTNFFTRVKGFH